MPSVRWKIYFDIEELYIFVSCNYAPLQNGTIEWKNRHLLDIIKTIIFENHVTKKFYGHAILTSVHLIIRMPTRILDGKTLYYLFHIIKSKILIPKGYKCLVTSSDKLYVMMLHSLNIYLTSFRVLLRGLYWTD